MSDDAWPAPAYTPVPYAARIEVAYAGSDGRAPESITVELLERPPPGELAALIGTLAAVAGGRLRTVSHPAGRALDRAADETAEVIPLRAAPGETTVRMPRPFCLVQADAGPADLGHVHHCTRYAGHGPEGEGDKVHRCGACGIAFATPAQEASQP